MSDVIPVLAVVAVLFILGLAAFLAIVISIQRVDRSKRLSQAPRSHLDAATRRVLGAHHSSGRRHTKES